MHEPRQDQEISRRFAFSFDPETGAPQVPGRRGGRDGRCRHPRLPDDRQGAGGRSPCAGRAPGRPRTSSTSTPSTSPRRSTT
ncbi:MAG: hypothetical protein MZW92_51180 [Comamonadaceae bacterium]|nr:hypothetical protein [Comamonadaceae bacterium]